MRFVRLNTFVDYDQELLPVANVGGTIIFTVFFRNRRGVTVWLTAALYASPGAAVAAICRRLDGLPLAIELAAVRIKLLSPGAILARLDHRLALLTNGARELPPRLRSLRGALDWSYALLSPAEQALFRQRPSQSPRTDGSGVSCANYGSRGTVRARSM